MVAFYRKIFVPGNAVLVVVGDVRPDAITAALEARFRTWAPGPIPRNPVLPPTPAPAGYESVYLIDKPGAVQSILTLCKVGPARKSPDFHALTVMNKILGAGYEAGSTTTCAGTRAIPTESTRPSIRAGDLARSSWGAPSGPTRPQTRSPS